MTSEQKQYFTLRVTSANKTEMIEILYEMLLEYLDEAEEAMSREDNKEMKEDFRKARGCVNELLNSVNSENALSGNFIRLYNYILKEMTRSEMQCDKELLNNVRKVIIPLKDTYQTVMKQDTSDPVMQNTQKVVAGITYSKNSINETLSESGKRGFYV